jgi:hypothetical protein
MNVKIRGGSLHGPATAHCFFSKSALRGAPRGQDVH